MTSTNEIGAQNNDVHAQEDDNYFEIHDVYREILALEVEDEYEDFPCVRFTVKTKLGSHEFFEWLNEDDELERIDSHVLTNESDEMNDLFERQRTGLCNPTRTVHADVPFSEIYDEVDQILFETPIAPQEYVCKMF